jgi:hypothetical protein
MPMKIDRVRRPKGRTKGKRSTFTSTAHASVRIVSENVDAYPTDMLLRGARSSDLALLALVHRIANTPGRPRAL